MEPPILFLPPFYLAAISLGALGQALRGALGLLKEYRTQGRFRFDAILFASTLLLGGASGFLVALVYDLPGTSPGEVTYAALANDRNFILMAVAAGYFGADVIEGVLGRYSPAKPK